MNLTKAEKAQLIAHLKALREKHLTALRNEADKIAKRCEKKVARRLNKVSVTIRTVRLLDVLEMERDHSPSIQELRKQAKDA